MSDDLPGLFSILHQFELIAIGIMEPLLVSTGWALRNHYIRYNPLFLQFLQSIKDIIHSQGKM